MVVKMPPIAFKMRHERLLLKFEISKNDGVDWHTEPENNPILYVLREEPQIYHMSANLTNLRGGFNLYFNILNLYYRPDCLVPGNMSCGQAVDLAFCRFGQRESLLVYVNYTSAYCDVPS